MPANDPLRIGWGEGSRVRWFSSFFHKFCVAIVPTIEGELLLKFTDPQTPEMLPL